MKNGYGVKFAFGFVFLAGLALSQGCASKPQSDSTSAATNTDSAGASGATGAHTAAAHGSGATPPGATPPKGPRTRTDTPPKPDIACARQGDSRILEIEEVHAGCWLFYNNRGIKKRIAWSKNGNAHCEKVRDQIRVSLEKGGYQCKWD